MNKTDNNKKRTSADCFSIWLLDTNEDIETNKDKRIEILQDSQLIEMYGNDQV